MPELFGSRGRKQTPASVVSDLLEGLAGVARLTDKPGAMARGIAARKPWADLSGRQLLEEYDAVGPNEDQGWIPDRGDVAGFGVEAVVDPMNLLGIGALARVAKARALTKQANAKSMALREAGAMPEEVAKQLHPALLDESGNPRKLYHGTPVSGVEAQTLTPHYSGATTDGGYYGKAVYMTPYRSRAGIYAEKGGNRSGAVVQAFVDSRHPLVSGGDFVDDLERHGISGFSRTPYERAQQAQDLTDSLLSKRFDAVFRGRDPIPDEIAVFNQNRIYAPYVAPALREVPSLDAQIQLLLQHNAGKLPLEDL